MAAKKKDFSAVNTNRVFDTIAEATADPGEQLEGQLEMAADGTTTEPRKERKTYSAEEQAEFLASLKTAGHKGCKLPRINLAFSPENYDYIRAMAKDNGVTMTELINDIITANRERNKARYEQIKENREGFIL